MFRFHILNMTCGGCASTVKKALLSIDSAAQIETDPPTRSVSIISDYAESDFQAVLAEAGYPASDDAGRQGAA